VAQYYCGFCEFLVPKQGKYFTNAFCIQDFTGGVTRSTYHQQQTVWLNLLQTDPLESL
jgi:hypothetical protein